MAVQVIDGFLILHYEDMSKGQVFFVKGSGIYMVEPFKDNQPGSVIFVDGSPIRVGEFAHDVMSGIQTSYKQAARR